MKNKRYETLIKSGTIYNAVLDQKFNILRKSGMRYKLTAIPLNGTIDDSHNVFIAMIDTISLYRRMRSSRNKI